MPHSQLKPTPEGLVLFQQIQAGVEPVDRRLAEAQPEMQLSSLRGM